MSIIVPNHHLFDDYSVIVSAFPSYLVDESSEIEEKFFLKFLVDIVFQPPDDARKRSFLGHHTQKTFKFSRDLFSCPQDAKGLLSSCFKFVSFAFPLDRLYWTECGGKTPTKSLTDKDGILTRVLNFCQITNANNITSVSVCIRKAVILSPSYFEEWVYFYDEECKRDHTFQYRLCFEVKSRPQLELDLHVNKHLRRLRMYLALRRVVGLEDVVGEQVCPICISNFELDDYSNDDKKIIIQTRCSHLFHRNCIKNWLKKHSTCPYCRFSLIRESN